MKFQQMIRELYGMIKVGGNLSLNVSTLPRFGFIIPILHLKRDALDSRFHRRKKFLCFCSVRSLGSVVVG